MRQLRIAVARSLLGLGAGLCLAAPLAAQEVTRDAAFDDWAVFTTAAAAECFVATSELTPVDAAAPAQLIVTWRQGRPGRAEVSFYAGGRAVAPGSAMSLQAGDGIFVLFSDGQWGWSANAEADAGAVTALAAAPEARVTLVTSDSASVTLGFSQKGFAAARDRAAALCSGSEPPAESDGFLDDEDPPMVSVAQEDLPPA